MFNGDIGSICKIHPDKLCVDFDGRIVEYSKRQLGDLELAYAITIHKSMGSEYETVIPILMAHRILLTKNLIYTAVTRAKNVGFWSGRSARCFWRSTRQKGQTEHLPCRTDLKVQSGIQTKGSAAGRDRAEIEKSRLN